MSNPNLNGLTQIPQTDHRGGKGVNSNKKALQTYTLILSIAGLAAAAFLSVSDECRW